MQASRKILQIRLDGLRIAMASQGIETYSDLAVAMDVEESTLHRVLNGARNPGTRFVRGLLRVAPHMRIADLLDAPEDPAGLAA